MQRALSLMVRFGVVLACAAVFQMTARPPSGARSPYASPLEALTATSIAQAAAHCADKTCASVGGGCVPSPGTFCAKSGGQCFTRGC